MAIPWSQGPQTPQPWDLGETPPSPSGSLLSLAAASSWPKERPSGTIPWIVWVTKRDRIVCLLPSVLQQEFPLREGHVGTDTRALVGAPATPLLWTAPGRRAVGGIPSLFWKPARDQWAMQQRLCTPAPISHPPVACSLGNHPRVEMGRPSPNLWTGRRPRGCGAASPQHRQLGTSKHPC